MRILTLKKIQVLHYTSEQIEYEYFEDGSYLMTVITENNNSGISLYASSKSGSKTTTFYNADNEAMWYVKVTGTFTYGNGTSTCTNSVVTAEAYGSTWKISEKSASKSGNTASATATAKHYFTFVCIQTVTETVTLSCSSTGVLS